MKVKINCTNIEIKLEELNDFQGNLKDLLDDDYQKLRKQIVENGFIDPFSVWKSPENVFYLLDGHQRLRTLRKMKESGDEIPSLFPAMEISAPTVTRAKQILLSLVSQYGTLSRQGLYEYLDRAQIDIDELVDFKLPDHDIDFEQFKLEYFADPKEVPMPGLTGNDPSFQQVTFVLSNEQKDILDEALEKAKKTEDCSDEINENKNGNVITAIMKRYIYG